MDSTQLFSERPSTLPASVAFRVQPLPAVSPVQWTGAACAPVGAYRLGEGDMVTAAERRLADIPVAGNGISVSAAKASADQIGTNHNTKKLYDATTVDRMTGVGGDPPRGRPN